MKILKANGAKMPKNAFLKSQEKPESSSKKERMKNLQENVANRFGVLPNFFTLVPQNPEISESVWEFTFFAYLNNPLPSLFKERLFVYLSRFCPAHYCITRHIGFLIGLGYPSGDKDAPTESVERVLQLIRRPLPLLKEIEVHIKKLHDTPLALIDLQSLDERIEESIFSCAIHVFLQTASALPCLEALKRIFDKTQFQYLLVFFLFVRAGHFWTKVHPELRLEKDVEQLIGDYEELAEAIRNDSEAKTFIISQNCIDEIYKLRQEKAYFKNQIDRYEKLHQKDKEELKSARASLVERITEELADSKLLQQVSSRLIEEENIEKLYGQIIEVAKAIMHSDAVIMQEYVPEKKSLYLLASEGFNPNTINAYKWINMQDKTSCAIAMKEHKHIIIPDVESCDFLDGADVLEVYRMSNIRSVQSTPLISRSGEIVGMISNYWKKVHQPSERDFAMLEVITRQAADLLERVHAQTALNENESWLNGQKEAFQAAMSGLSLTKSLKALVDTFVAQTNGEARAAFYWVPPGGEGLHHIVGMSDAYAEEVKGFKVGPESLACGLAMHTGEAVITQDVDEDLTWERWRWLARKHNFRGCWSIPVRTEGGPVVGTFALYFSQPRKPIMRELELAGILAHAAAIIISRDRELMERTQAEEALRESEKKLKTLVRLRDEFIGNASHELQTPLTSIMVYAEKLEQHFNEVASPQQAEMMRKLRLQVDRLHILIRDMLDTTHLAEEILVLSISNFDLNELIRESAEELQRVTQKHKIMLQLKSLEEVVADKDRIGQVITNLLSNAIKYSSRGGNIMVSSELDGNFVKVSIADQGIGIPADALEKIFERFYRVDSKKAKTYPGMGIGLSICRGIIDMHRGKITAESKEGSGSKFTFVIPLKHMGEDK